MGFRLELVQANPQRPSNPRSTPPILAKNWSWTALFSATIRSNSFWSTGCPAKDTSRFCFGVDRDQDGDRGRDLDDRAKGIHPRAQALREVSWETIILFFGGAGVPPLLLILILILIS